MGTRSWGTDRPVKEILFKEGHRFDFYQAVRLIENLFPEKIPVGEGSEPEKETVRFKSRVDHEFPAGTISEISHVDGDNKPPEMIINFMGLAGCLGPLPAPYTELILERSWAKDTALKAFLDIFNHRLISLMYRVKKIHRIGFDLKSPEKGLFIRYLFSLMGMGTGSLQDRMGIRDRALLFYAGLIAQQPRSVVGLEFILFHYFNVKVKVNQFSGQWSYLEQEQITSIGRLGQNQILGQSALLGVRVWDQQGKFELVLGPMSIALFLDFLPCGVRFSRLYHLTRFYAGTEFEFDFKLILQAKQVPESRIGKTAGPRLGWTSWLKTGKFEAKYGIVKLSPRLLGHWLK